MRVLFVLLVMLLLVTGGCAILTDADGNVMKVVSSEHGLAVVLAQKDVDARVLRALVKGSIYETGETVSVFGTCLDSDDLPFNGTYAKFSAWYPNGTAFIVNQSLPEIQQGYYLYTAAMSAVQGTYLTELDCFLNGTNQTAKAFGEWQNPYWVKRIALLNQSLGNISNNISAVLGNISELNDSIANLSQNITVTIGNLSVNMSDSFDITWDKIESVNQTVLATNSTLYEELVYVAGVANASVDRNDSLLAQLLYNITGYTAPPVSGALVNWTEDADYPHYYRTWEIRVDTYDPSGGARLQYPDVLCDINTTLTPTSTQMTVQGNHWIYDEFITQLGDFSWNVSCYWA